MADIIREAAVGQIIRWVTRNKFLKYPEEEPDFQCPNCYQDPESSDSLSIIQEKNSGDESPDLAGRKEVADIDDRDDHHKQYYEGLQTLTTNATVDPEFDEHKIEKLYTQKTHATIQSSVGARPTLTRTKTREMTRAFTRERLDIEQEKRSLRALDLPIIAQKNEAGDILVDWYTTDDPANPQNWPSMKKAFVGFQIW